MIGSGMHTDESSQGMSCAASIGFTCVDGTQCAGPVPVQQPGSDEGSYPGWGEVVHGSKIGPPPPFAPGAELPQPETKSASQRNRRNDIETSQMRAVYAEAQS
jgi:hypothetical protein